MLTRSRVIVFLPTNFIVAFVLGVATPIFSAEAPQKIRIAYASRSSSAMPQYMALQKGYFKGEGLEVADACEAADLTGDRVLGRNPGAAGGLSSRRSPPSAIRSTWSHRAGPDEYRQAIHAALNADETDALLIIYTPVDSSQSSAILAGIRAGINAGRRSAGRRNPSWRAWWAKQAAH